MDFFAPAIRADSRLAYLSNLSNLSVAGGPAAGRGPAMASPIEYTMMLHPPLVVENLLPYAGSFELVDQVHILRV